MTVNLSPGDTIRFANGLTIKVLAIEDDHVCFEVLRLKKPNHDHRGDADPGPPAGPNWTPSLN
jgi:hypothetical protein